jgi:hypothetical protein
MFFTLVAQYYDETLFKNTFQSVKLVSSICIAEPRGNRNSRQEWCIQHD